MSFSWRFSNVPVRSPLMSRRMKMSSRVRSVRLLEKMLRSPAIEASPRISIKVSYFEVRERLIWL